MRQFLPFSKDTEIFRWGPIPGRYFYVSEFIDSIFKEYSNIYPGERWPNTLFIFRDKKMVWLNDFDELRQAGKNVFLKYMLPVSIRNKLKKQWYERVKKLSSLEKKIGDLYLEDLPDDKLYSLWEEFNKLIVDFFVPTIPAELGNYGSDKLLKEKLGKYIKDESSLTSAIEILTAPGDLSFHQKEEIELSKTKNIEKHAAKYFWIKNSYNGVEESTLDFFNQRKNKLLPNIGSLIEERLTGIKNKKKKIIEKYKLPKEIKDISKALCDGIEWQDERKKYIFIYTYYKELFLKEVARRFGYNIDSLRNCSTRENMQLLEKRGVHILTEKRINIFGFFLNPLKEEFDGEEAKLCWDNYSEEKSDLQVKKI